MNTPSGTPPSGPRRLLKHLRTSDLRATAQLATAATRGVIGIAEGVHQSVLKTLGQAPGPTPSQTAGLTGQIYRAVHGVNALVGAGLEAALVRLLPPGLDAGPADTPERLAVISALNGVMGDRLAAMGNPLALGMDLRQRGLALRTDSRSALAAQVERPSNHVIVMLHGLCMNDLQWQGQGQDHGALLAQDLGASVLYLRYNTGLSILDNGQQLAGLLEQLQAHWPVPLTRLSLVGHSMGGLVARSALAAGGAAAQAWPGLLQDMVFIGTPHGGSPLERAGHWINERLAQTPFAAPFARLGRLRSAGITDLRHGRVAPGAQPGLPEGVACYAIAATLAGQRSVLSERLMGDGLVPLDSALGRQAGGGLSFAHASQRIFYRTGHIDLLYRPEVGQQLLDWLRPVGPASAAAAD
jgi:pimeloyl-ACP methyl ester carboxylesterase